MDTLENPNVVNLLHIFIVAPMLYAVGTDKVPDEFKQYFVYAAYAIIAYNAYLYFRRNNLLGNVIDKKRQYREKGTSYLRDNTWIVYGAIGLVLYYLLTNKSNGNSNGKTYY